MPGEGQGQALFKTLLLGVVWTADREEYSDNSPLCIGNTQMLLKNISAQS